MRGARRCRMPADPLRAMRATAWRTAACLLLLNAWPMLHAQRMDTTEVRNGRYGVFERGKDGHPLGRVAVYDTTGRLVGHETYRRGQRHGPAMWYDSLGRATLVLQYRKGRLHGPVVKYDSLGRKVRTTTYRNGLRHGREVFHRPDGRVHWQLAHRNGQHHGPGTTYHRNGRVEWTKPYRDGALHGERVVRDSTGALVNGPYRTDFPSGLGHYTITCIDGRPEGELVVLRTDGTVSYTGAFVKGMPHGEFIYYDQQGAAHRKERYEMGRLVHASRRGGEGPHTPGQYP